MHAEAIQVYTLATPEELRELWAELPEDPALEAYRVELTERAEIVMTPPPASRHQWMIQP